MTDISGVFAATTADSAEDIVVVAAPGGVGSSRTFIVYASDGTSISELFDGDGTGNLFDLQSADAEVTGSLDSFGATGNLNLPSSSTTYDAPSAISPAGLYTVTVDMVGHTVTGTSTTGSQLSATISTTEVAGGFAVTGTVTSSGGAAQNISATVTSDSTGQQDWIVMPDLSIRGGHISSGTGFATSG